VQTIGFLLVRAGQGSRGPLIATLAVLTLLYAYDKRIRVASKTVVAVVLACTLIFRIVGDDRVVVLNAFQDKELSLEQVEIGQKGQLLESMDYANSVFLEYVVNVVPARSGTYNYFADVLEIFTGPIPRKWWPGKPAGSPVVLVNLFDYGFPIGMTFSLPGEGWFSLGWVGVVVWCGACGAWLGIWYERFASGTSGLFRTLTYLTFYPVLIVGFRDGVLVTVLKQSLWFLVPIGVWALVARRLLGIPSYEEIRASRSNEETASMRNSRALRSGAMSAATATALPPAVLRRKAALAAMRDVEEAGPL